MSQANVEVVKRLYDLWERDGVGVVPELMDPTIEWVNPPYAVEPGIRHGYDGFAHAIRAVRDVYSDYQLSARRFYDAGDRVAVRARVAVHSAVSTVPVETERGYVFDLRDGKIIRFAWFNAPDEALKAVGLEEE